MTLLPPHRYGRAIENRNSGTKDSLRLTDRNGVQPHAKRWIESAESLSRDLKRATRCRGGSWLGGEAIGIVLRICRTGGKAAGIHALA